MNTIIAYGRKSELFRASPGTVLKLYEKNFPRERIHQEFNKAKTVWKTGRLKLAKPIQEITKEGRHGILFEEIRGVSLMDILQQKPWVYISGLSTITAVHKTIHQLRIEGLPTQEDEFSTIIQSSDRISAKDKTQLLDILTKHHDPVLCHGDFHHGNLMQTSSGDIYILDWMDAFVGSYQLDVALTAVNASISTAPEHIPMFYRQAYEILKRILRLDLRYLNHYPLQDPEDYLFLASAIHLARYDGEDRSLHLSYYQQARANYTSMVM